MRGAAVQAHQQRDQRPHAGECQQGQRVDPIRQIVAAAADGWIAGPDLESAVFQHVLNHPDSAHAGRPHPRPARRADTCPCRRTRRRSLALTPPGRQGRLPAAAS
ncbi:hypothetical protein G6F32_016624 [Rhizopus arrhizus]|nr:hypothetical protein G6F32_016624 [Rhizopus arrhizus]